MTHPTDEELDALVFALDHLHPDDISSRDCSDAITALRAQLAEVQAELTFMTENRNKWQDSATQRWFRIEEANDRADRAEASRAAQIEADAGIADRAAHHAMREGMCYASDGLSTAYHNVMDQPHDRTALDRMLADAEAKALRKAADLPHRIERLGGQNYSYVRVEEILAMIPKEGA